MLRRSEITKQAILLVTIVIDDYDRAKNFYCETLGFDCIEDTALGDGKRWLVVRPPGSDGASLLLAQAADERQKAAIGAQTGGRVAFFLRTDDFARDHAALTVRGVHFLEAPRHEAYGTVAVFEDLYGNRWDLLQPA